MRTDYSHFHKTCGTICDWYQDFWFMKIFLYCFIAHKKVLDHFDILARNLINFVLLNFTPLRAVWLPLSFKRSSIMITWFSTNLRVDPLISFWPQLQKVLQAYKSEYPSSMVSSAAAIYNLYGLVAFIHTIGLVCKRLSYSSWLS